MCRKRPGFATWTRSFLLRGSSTTSARALKTKPPRLGAAGAAGNELEGKEGGGTFSEGDVLQWRPIYPSAARLSSNLVTGGTASFCVAFTGLHCRILSASIGAAAVSYERRDGVVPVLIVGGHRQRCEALKEALVRHGLLAMCTDGAAEARAVANVIQFKVAVFLGTIDQEATEAMRELRTRHGTRGIAVNGKSSQDEPDGPAAAFARRLPDPVTEETLVQHIRELRAAG